MNNVNTMQFFEQKIMQDDVNDDEKKYLQKLNKFEYKHNKIHTHTPQVQY